VEEALARSQGGLGIGLNLAKRLVEMHGGCIEAKSAGQGLGSEFLIRLPIVVERTYTTSDGVVETDNPLPLTKLRILVVDDNRDAAASLAMLLKLMGNFVCTAHDGLRGLEAAKEHRPDVILLDIGLPKMNGYDVARSIRQESWGQRMVLIAVTGWGQEEDRRKSQEAGFDRHMVKPVDPQTLIRLLADFQIAKA
jgi:CheY-like chemotaxis protein